MVEPETELKAVNVGVWRFTGSSGTIECEEVRFERQTAHKQGRQDPDTIQTSNFTGDDPINKSAQARFRTDSAPRSHGRSHPKSPPRTTGASRPTATLLEAEFKLTGTGCTQEPAPLRFSLDATAHSGLSLGTCVVERSSASGTYNKNSSPLELTLGGGMEFKLVSGGAFCPKALTLDGKLRLETASGQQLKIV